MVYYIHYKKERWKHCVGAYAHSGATVFMKSKNVGIIGGMGPLATADIFTRITELTPAKGDNQHLHIFVDSNPKLPSRVDHIEGRGVSPIDGLVRMATRLQEWGADFLIMPCNTAHHYYDDICRSVDIPFLHMPRIVSQKLSEAGAKKVALLATTPTTNIGIYEKELAQFGIEQILPDEKQQADIMHLIFDGVKSGDFSFGREILVSVIDSLKSRGAEYIILGCTELPIAAARYGLSDRLLDSTQVLAEETVRYALGGTEETGEDPLLTTHNS